MLNPPPAPPPAPRAPSAGDLLGPLSWAVVLAGIPAIGAALGLAAVCVSSDSSLVQLLTGVAAVVVVQLGWVGPALAAARILARVHPQIPARARSLRVMAPAFLISFLLALPIAFIPLVAIPAFVFGPAVVARSLMSRAIADS